MHVSKFTILFQWPFLFVNLVSCAIIMPDGFALTNSSNVCHDLFNNERLSEICRHEKSICGCRLDYINSTSTFAALVTGTARTFHITYPSLVQHILKPNNNQLDIIYVLQNFHIIRDLKALNLALSSGIAVVAHGSEVWESMVNYTQKKHRMFNNKFLKLDEIQRHHQSGGIIDMWSNLAIGQSISTSIRIQCKKEYILIIKTRPDLVYFSDLNLTRLLSEYKTQNLTVASLDHHNMESPPNTIQHGGEDIKVTEDVTMGQYLYTTEPPLFVPGCVAFGGLTDRLFVGPPVYMDKILNDEVIKDILSLNYTLQEHIRIGASEILSPARVWVPGHGLEGVMKSIVLWYHIPVATIPVKGDLRFLWGILRPTQIESYCNGSWTGHWTEMHCLLISDKANDIQKTSFESMRQTIVDACKPS